jgi:hypothetical protein
VADNARPPVAVRIVRPFDTEEAFLENELETVGKTSVILIGAHSRPTGVILRFEVVLANGATVLRGEGRVLAHKENAFRGQPGLALRFTRLDPKSKAVVDRAAAIREARLGGAPPAPPTPEPISAPQRSQPPRPVQPGSGPRQASVRPVPGSMKPTAPPHAANTARPADPVIAQMLTSATPPPPETDGKGRKTDHSRSLPVNRPSARPTRAPFVRGGSDAGPGGHAAEEEQAIPAREATPPEATLREATPRQATPRQAAPQEAPPEEARSNAVAPPALDPADVEAVESADTFAETRASRASEAADAEAIDAHASNAAPDESAHRGTNITSTIAAPANTSTIAAPAGTSMAPGSTSMAPANTSTISAPSYVAEASDDTASEPTVAPEHAATSSASRAPENVPAHLEGTARSVVRPPDRDALLSRLRERAASLTPEQRAKILRTSSEAQ